LQEPDELTSSASVTELLHHIKNGDAFADDSALALALLIEGGPHNARLSPQLIGDLAKPGSRAGRAEAAADAVRELRRYISETPMPLPSAVWALGKAHDRGLADTFSSVLIRALDGHAEPLAHQALAALTTLPADAVPVDTIRLAAAKGRDEVRELAEAWLTHFAR
jgi:hypothetical protein